LTSRQEIFNTLINKEMFSTNILSGEIPRFFTTDGLTTLTDEEIQILQ